MTNVEFEEGQDALSTQSTYTSHTILGPAVRPGMANLFVKAGIAKSERQGYYYLVTLSIICLAAAAAILYYQFTPTSLAPVQYYEDIPDRVRNSMPKDYLNSLPHRNV